MTRGIGFAMEEASSAADHSSGNVSRLGGGRRVGESGGWSRKRESLRYHALLAVVALAVRSVDRLVWRDGSDISSCTLLNCQSSVLFGAMRLSVTGHKCDVLNCPTSRMHSEISCCFSFFVVVFPSSPVSDGTSVNY